MVYQGAFHFFMGRSGWCINVVHLTVEDPFTKTIFNDFFYCVPLHKCLLGETDLDFSFYRNGTFYSYQTTRVNDLSLPRCALTEVSSGIPINPQKS